jgi:DNA ligase (NAD+)
MDSITQYTIQNYTHDQIREQLNDARIAYHNGRRSKFTDDQYDYLMDYVGEEQKVGAYPTSESQRVRLPIHMGSMDKIKADTTEFTSFLRDYRNVKCISEKLDGISLLIDFSRRPVTAYTRGNGDVGQDVTHILPYIRGIPQIKTTTFSGYVRGEAIVSRPNWKKIEERGKNARNFVAGVIHSKQANPNDLREIEFVAYEYIPSPFPNEIMSSSIQFSYLKSIGFNVVKHIVIQHKRVTSEAMIILLDEWRQTSNYEIDGIIIANDASYPITVKGNPSHAKAFKHNVLENAVETRVTRVEWNISKDGKWKPVVNVEPFDLEGVTIQRATGYNARFIEENGIGTGAVVRIIRSGGVIPKIVSIKTKVKEVELPEGKWDDTHTELISTADGSATTSASSSSSTSSSSQNNSSNSYNENSSIILTTNQMILAKKIEYFVTTCEIDFYKEKLIQRGILCGVITSIKDLMMATPDTFMKIDSIRDKMAEKIHQSVQSKIQTISLPVYMSAISVFPKIGVKKMTDLMSYRDGEIIRKMYRTATSRCILEIDNLRDAIMDVDGYSSKSVSTVTDNKDTMMKELDWIIQAFPNTVMGKTAVAYKENRMDLIAPSHTQQSSSSSSEFPQVVVRRVNGKTFIFTGFRDKKLEEDIVKMGGRIGTRVRENSVLVAKEIRSATTKIREAQMLRCAIMDESDFRRYLYHPELHPNESASSSSASSTDDIDTDVDVIDLTD